MFDILYPFHTQDATATRIGPEGPAPEVSSRVTSKLIKDDTGRTTEQLEVFRSHREDFDTQFVVRKTRFIPGESKTERIVEHLKVANGRRGQQLDLLRDFIQDDELAKELSISARLRYPDDPSRDVPSFVFPK